MAAEAAQKRQELGGRARAHASARRRRWTRSEYSRRGATAYLAEKGVVSHGLRQDAVGRLLVPLTTLDGKLWSFQRIGPDGFKQFYEGGLVKGGRFVSAISNTWGRC